MTRGKTVVLMVVGLMLCLVSAIATSNFLTNGGKTTVENLKVRGEFSGSLVSMKIFIPANASAKKNPLPAVVAMHGGNNSKENMNINYVELQRRGYVVFVPDMLNMGNSERFDNAGWTKYSRGLYDTVVYASGLPFVDKNRISVVGYSRGGACTNEAILLDNATPNKLIKSAFIIHSDPKVKDGEGKWTDAYGSRDIALLADKYDEFFFSEKNFSAKYDNDANRYAKLLSSSVDFVGNPSAQSFLNFGADPDALTEKRTSETVYQKQYPDKIATRIIYSTPMTHMSGWWSEYILQKEFEFLSRANPTPVSVPTNDFEFKPNTFFGFVGLLGFFIFLVSFTKYLVTEFKPFADLNLGEPTRVAVKDAAGKAWFWATEAVIIGVGVFVVWLLNTWKMNIFIDPLFRSAQPIYQALWGVTMAVVILLMSMLWYQVYGKKNNIDLASTGLYPGWAIIGKSLLAGVLVVSGCWVVLVGGADYLFGTDYHAVLWFLIPFEAFRIPGMLAVFPLFAIFYVTLSLSMNCFNYSDVTGKNKWVSSLLMSTVAALPPLVVILYTYGSFMATGKNPMFGGLAASGTAMIWAPVVIFTGALVCRKIYEVTKNPWLGGFVSATIVTIFIWTQVEIRIPIPGAKFTINWYVYSLIILGVVGVIAAYLYFQKQKSGADVQRSKMAVPTN